jgi:hypothetical protein
VSEETVTVTYGKAKVVLSVAAIVAIIGAIGWVLYPKGDDKPAIDNAIPAIQRDVTDIKVSVARIEGRLEELTRPRNAVLAAVSDTAAFRREQSQLEAK